MFRLKRSLLARLDAHARRMEEKTLGVKFTRTDALRSLLETALRAAEREADE